MNTKLAFLLLTPLALIAADTDFNGRWNIRVQTPRGRVWWLEVKGAGSGKVEGSFVGAPGGQVDPLTDARIENGELIFSFERPGPLKQVFRARLADGQLKGTREETNAGKTSPELAWTGIRAPVIREHDDGTWKPGANKRLFDGKTTGGWHLLVAGLPGWYVEDGLLKNEKRASDIVSDAKFWNFEAKIEYRYSQGSNSGVGLRGRYEVQIYDNFGKEPDMHGNGALYSRIAPKVNASKAPGEWQTMVVRLVGRDLTVTVNGVKVIDRQEVVGPTAITMDPEEDRPGPFVLQGDHGPVEFRSVEVTELVKK